MSILLTPIKEFSPKNAMGIEYEIFLIRFDEKMAH